MEQKFMVSRFTDLGIGKVLALAVLAMGAVAGPVAFGLMQKAPLISQILEASGPLPSFQAASIRPNHSESGFASIGAGVLSGPAGPAIPKDRFIATNITVKSLIQWAWAPGDSRPLPDDQVSGGPSWINSDRYDIEAKLEDPQIAALEKLARSDRAVQMKLMLQSLLADRFHLMVKVTKANGPVYALVVAKGGPKLEKTAAGSTPAPGSLSKGTLPPPPPPGARQGPAAPPGAALLSRHREWIASAQPVSALAKYLREELGRPVLDQTGLRGNYNFELMWTTDLNSPRAIPGPSPGVETAPPDASGPSIFTAVQEQLGLKLVSTKGPVEAIAIVHVEKPSEN